MVSGRRSTCYSRFRTFDHVKGVTIIGGGPAGAMTAETLARGGVRATVYEERLGWEKPCGGGLSYKALRRYPFLLDALDDHRRVREAEFIASGATLRFPLREPLAIYSRAKLNQLLLCRATRSGAEVVHDRIRAFRRKSAGWTLEGRTRNYHADFLVLAAGARSRLRSALAEDFRARDFMLTFGYYVPGSDEVLRVQFFEDFEGYAWAFPRQDHLSVGICGKVGEERMCGMRERLHQFMRTRGYSPTGSAIYSHVLPSLSLESWGSLRLAGDGWVLAGDAAGLVDPLTGEGIYYAMRSGELVAELLLGGSPASYPERVRQEFGDLALGGRVAPIFYCGDFLGASVTRRMIDLAARSAAFMELVQDFIGGSQGYSGFGGRLCRTLWRMAGEVATGALRG